MKSRERGAALLQALLIVILGAALGVGLDLVLPRGVLRNAPAVLRDLEFLEPVYLWTPQDAAAALESGEIVLIDGRLTDEFDAAHPAGALSIAMDREEELSDGLVADLAGASLVVLLGEEDFEESRLFARDLSADVGADRVGTIQGGFEAWQAAGLAVEGNERP